jgi:hypothetical protein
MGSGKSYVAKLWADVIERQTGQTVGVADISLPLKTIAANAVGQDVAYIEEHKGEFRVLLQELGRLLRMVKGQNFLIDHALDSAAAQDYGYCENIRMPGEYIALRQRDWVLVGIVCDEDTRIARLTGKYGRPPTEAELNHETERHIPTLLSMCDLVLENNTEQQARDNALFLTQTFGAVAQP